MLPAREVVWSRGIAEHNTRGLAVAHFFAVPVTTASVSLMTNTFLSVMASLVSATLAA